MRRRIGSGDDEDGMTTVAIDTRENTVGAVLIICAVLFAAASTPGEEAVRESTPPGNVLIEAYWPEGHDTDVDLWVKGPEGAPVGYSNKGGVHLNYLRDDLGKRTKDDPANYELIASRGLVPGGYCVNVHLYSNRSSVLPMPVKVTVKIAKGIPGTEDVKGGGDPVLVTDVNLSAEGKERNAFCFALNEQGDMIREGSKKPFTSNKVCLRSPSGCSG